MLNDLPPDETPVVSAPPGKTQDDSFFEGVATGCFGCFGAVIFSIIGFVAGYALVGVAHEHEWFYTQEEFNTRHGLSDAGLRAFGNCMMGAFFGAVLLPVVGAYACAFLGIHKPRGRKQITETKPNSSTN